MILVTGSTGLLGSHLLFELCRKGYSLRALEGRSSAKSSVEKLFRFYDPSNADEYLQKIEWVKGDVRDIFSLEDALEGVEYVYHCAAVVSFDPRDQRLMTEINDRGTANVVNACLDAGVKKLCHVSSTAAIGRSKDSDLINEKTQWKNAPENSWYAITKYNAEREVWRGIEEGLPAVIVNPCVILGPADWNSGSTAMFRQASGGMKFYTEGGNAVVDARDVAEIMVRLMEGDSTEQRYLLIGENIPFRQLFDKMGAAFGKPPASIRANRFMTGFAWRWEKLRSTISGRKPLITRETARAAHATYVYDNKKIKSALGVSFRTADEMIKNAVAFFRSV